MHVIEAKELKPIIEKTRKNKKGEEKKNGIRMHVGFKVSFDDCPASLTQGQKVYVEQRGGIFKPYVAHGTYVVFCDRLVKNPLDPNGPRTPLNTWSVTGPVRLTYSRLPYKERPVVVKPEKNGGEKGLTGMSEAKFREKFPVLAAMAINAINGAMAEAAA